MNCQDFENNLHDLAHGALMDARTRAAALAHADSCRRCDTRLADEKTLRAGLRSLAASASHEEAPPRVESALLAAFRSQAAAHANEETGAPVVIADSNVAPLKRRAGEKQWSWMKTFATAATAAAAAAALLMIIPPGMDAPPADTVAEMPGKKEVSPQGSRMIEPVRDGVNDDGGTPEVAKAEPPRAFNSPRGGRVTATPFVYSPSVNSRAQTPRRERPDEEVVTEFIPLGNSDYLASDDARQVGRVELPRSALSSIGLPVSADRAGERIKADVLLGEDGLARAIRFVR